MDEHFLQRLCLFLTICGIVILFFLVVTIEPKNIKISDIDESMIGYYVTVYGVVSSKPIWSEENLFFDLSDGEKSIKVVMFSRDTRKYNELKIRKGNEVVVIGRVSEYKGELEIVAEKIVVK